MNEKEIKAQTKLIRQSCDIIDSLLSPSTIIKVNVGDNLASIIEQAPEGAILSIVPEYKTEADLVLSKPITLLSTKPISGRASPLNQYPTVIGSLISKAPASVTNLRLTGKIKEKTLVDSGDYLIFDRCLVIGSSLGQHRGILTNAGNIVIKQCSVIGIIDSIDTQALAAWDNCKNLLVDDCYLEASGENVLFGGADASSENNIPQGITISNCDLTKLLSWKGNPNITAKNLFEIKCARKVILSNCNLSNSWTSGQDGYGILLTVRNQDGNAPFSTIEDVLISNNTITNTVSGIQILGRDYTNPSQIMKRVNFKGNKFTNLNGGKQVFISNGSQSLTLDSNSFIGYNLNSALNFDNPSNLNSGMIVKNNYFQEGDYGIFGTDAPSLGKAAIDMYAPGYLWDTNTIKKGTSGRNITYPNGTILIP